MIIVSNTSPITNLSAINQLKILQELYSTIIISQAVYDEMANYNVPGSIEVKTLPWIQTQQVSNRLLVRQLKQEINPGEAEAIALAVELQADRLLLDDYKARQVAFRLEIKFIGILGLLLIAKQRGSIETVTSIIYNLINQAGFRVSYQLHMEVLKAANEFFPSN